MTMDWGNTAAVLIFLSPLIILLLSLTIGAITLAFGAGATILAGLMNLITRPIQSLLWVIKWVLLISATFAALWGFIWLFYPEHRLHGGLILAGAVAAGFISVLCELGRDWLKEKAEERQARRALKREEHRQSTDAAQNAQDTPDFRFTPETLEEYVNFVKERNMSSSSKQAATTQMTDVMSHEGKTIINTTVIDESNE